MIITDCYSGFMATKTPFGAALRYYRKEEPNLTQSKFSKIIGISQAMISRIEKGIDDGSHKIREKITKYFKVPYDDFLETGRKRLQSPQDSELASRVTAIELKIPEIIMGTTASANVAVNDLDKKKIAKNQPHHDLVNKFRNPDLALEMNEKIYEIEGLSDEAMEDINDYLDNKLKRLREKKGKHRPELTQENGTG